MKKIAGILLIAIVGGVVALSLHQLIFKNSTLNDKQENAERALAFASLKEQQDNHVGFDFVKVSELATPSVVHIKTIVEQSTAQGGNRGRSPFPEFFDFFGEGHGFDIPRGPGGGTGSGVILTADGYIATNNHVVTGASKIEITLQDKRTYVAELIGTDPTTDLALLKIAEDNLPFLPAGNSDELKVGQWVIAVGNPMNLTSTVTAGIVSAKGRSINLLRSNENRYAIENFIQTDAAINPGNSGGALVNTAGEVVGINTAIASQTGAFVGYGFAIPINLAKKVLDDLKKFGMVQRGLLGVSIQDVNADLAEKEGLKSLNGVYVFEVMENSAAEKAGVKKGDVILKVEDKIVNSSSDLQETIGQHRPGDKVKITVKRKGENKVFTATLLNKDGKAEPEVFERKVVNEVHGLVLEPLTKEDREKFGVRNGVKVREVKKGQLQGKIETGFIITHIDKAPVYNVQSAISQLETKSGGVLIEGKNAKGVTEVIGVLIDKK